MNDETEECEAREVRPPLQDLRARLIQYGLRIIRLCASLPNTPEGRLFRDQLVRSGTSPGARHREAYRARSQAEFISKMEGGLQELDESDYWLELIQSSGMVAPGRITPLRTETQELISIFTSSVLTAKRTRGERSRLR